MTDTEKAALERRIDELCAKVERLHADQAHWELGNCPSCPNVVSLQEALEQNAKLRELCEDMYGFIKRMDSECGDVTFSDCFDYCKHDTADDGCTKTGMCWYERRMRELGVEVEG